MVTKHQDILSTRTKDLYMSYTLSYTMAKDQNANTTEQASTSLTVAAGEKLTLRFADMSDEQKKEYLQRIMDEKPKDQDTAMLYQELAKAGIGRIPSPAIIRATFDVRRSLASGAMQLLSVGEQVQKIGLACVADGWTPQEARAYVQFTIRKLGIIGEGSPVSDKTIRRAFASHPQLMAAVDVSKTRKDATPEAAAEREKAKTPEQKEGLTAILLPPAACEAIAKYAAKKEGCILYIKGKSYAKVKASVVHERVVKKDGKTVLEKEAS